MKKLFLLLLIALLVVACAPNQGLKPQSDNKQASFDVNDRVEEDANIYTITGVIENLPQSLVRQYRSSRGSVVGSGGFVYGSYSGEVLDGKSMQRLRVQDVTPPTDLAPYGSIVLLKSTDTKASALLDGDLVTFKCRAQEEPVAAILSGEDLTDEHSTWELDYCRLASPVVLGE